MTYFTKKINTPYTNRRRFITVPIFKRNFAAAIQCQYNLKDASDKNYDATQVEKQKWRTTKSSAIAEGLYDALIQLKYCQLLHNCMKKSRLKR